MAPPAQGRAAAGGHGHHTGTSRRDARTPGSACERRTGRLNNATRGRGGDVHGDRSGPTEPPGLPRRHGDVARATGRTGGREPGRGGPGATGPPQERLPSCRVIILTTFGRTGYLKRAVESGAAGFLLKDAPAAELAAAIRRVMTGERVVDPALAATALSERGSPLTDRERDVLSASANGATIRDVAAKLYLSEGTVRNYLSTAIQKLGARNRVEEARLAQQKGWL